MSGDPKEIFRQKCIDLVERLGIKKIVIANKSGVNRSSVYGFLGKDRDNLEDQSLDGIALFLFGEKSWVDVAMARQEAERNQGREADTVKEGVAVNIGDLYIRIGEMQNEFKKQFESLNLKLDGHISNTSAHQHHDKKNSSGTNQK
jgi:hypothetical protein